MSDQYDVAIIGSRVAGATLAMLLARKGLKTVVVDKATFPSNKAPCTHTNPAGAVETVKRIGLYEPFIKAGADPVKRVDFMLPKGRYSGEIRTDGVPTPGMQLRRITMDNIIVQHARAAGAEVREAFVVRDLIKDQSGKVLGFTGQQQSGGPVQQIRARLTVAADGKRSIFGNESSFVKSWPCNRFYYYRYYEPGTPIEPIIWCWDDDPDIVCIGPVGEGLFLGMVAPHMSKFDDFVVDLEDNFDTWMRSKTILRDIIDSAKPVSRIWGRGNLKNTYRDPICNGLVLLGDAGLDIDPLAAQGVGWAFISAEILADVLGKCFTKDDLSAKALAEFRVRRDARLLENFKYFSIISLTKKRSPQEQEFMDRAIEDRDLASDLAGIWHLTVAPSKVFGAERFEVPIEKWETEKPLDYATAVNT